MKRCGKCRACLEVAQAQKNVLAQCGMPSPKKGRHEFVHADDATVEFWNRTLRENPCETWKEVAK
jgi:hypothetical protein